MKKRVDNANNTKNVMATILNRENEALALFNTKGLFCEPELIIGKCLPMKPSCTLENYILSHFPTMSTTLVDFIQYKGIQYSTRFYNSMILPLYFLSKLFSHKRFKISVTRLSFSFSRPSFSILRRLTKFS